MKYEIIFLSFAISFFTASKTSTKVWLVQDRVQSVNIAENRLKFSFFI